MNRISIIIFLSVVAVIVAALLFSIHTPVADIPLNPEGELFVIKESDYKLTFVAVNTNNGTRTELPLFPSGGDGAGTAYVLSPKTVYAFSANTRKSFTNNGYNRLYVYKDRFSRAKLESFSSLHLSKLNDVECVRFLPVCAVSALISFVNQGFSGDLESLTSLYEFGKTERVNAELAVNSSDSAFIFSPEWISADKFSFVAKSGLVVIAGIYEDGAIKVLSAQPYKPAPNMSIYARRVNSLNNISVAGSSFSLPIISDESIYKAGFVGISDTIQLKSFSATPNEKVYFTDSFMRVEETNVWQNVEGRWEIFGMRNPNESSNPFSLAFSTVETPSYQKLHDRGVTEQTGLGVRLNAIENGKKLEVTFVIENSPAANAGLLTGDKLVQVDDQPIEKMTQNQLKKYFEEKSDQEITLTIERQDDIKQLKVAPGAFDLTVKRYETKRNYIGDSKLAKRGMVLAGEGFWCDSVYSTSFKAYGAGTVGVIFDHRGGNDYYMVRWNSDEPVGGSPNSIELVWVTSKGEQVIASCKGGFLPGQYYRMTVDYRTENAIVSIDGTQVLSVKLEEKLCGKIGLIAANCEAVIFDDVIVTSDDPPKSRSKFADKFASDHLMKTWADTRYDWVSIGGSDYEEIEWDKMSRARWESSYARGFIASRRPVYGDAKIELVRPKFERNAEVGICGDRRLASHRGYWISIKPNGEFALHETSKQVAVCTYPGAYVPERIILQKNGDTIEVSDGASVFLSAPVKKHYDGGTAWFSGFDLPFRDGFVVSTDSPTTRDFSFDSVPVEWEIADGEWGTMTRWVCTPTWSYFGGRSDYLASIWSKETYGGNLMLDFYAGFAMPSYTRMPAEKPADLGITIFGDGKNVSSGITFILGADLNEGSIQIRNGEQKPLAFKLNTNTDQLDMSFHQRWLRVTISVIDNKLTVISENKVVAEFDLNKDDPKEGRIAIWTLDNSILFARAYLSASSCAPSPLLSKKYMLGKVGPFYNIVDGKIKCRIDKIGDRYGEPIYEVSPIWGGGTNEFMLAIPPINIKDTPMLTFSVSDEANPAWDFYFKYNNRRYKVGLFNKEIVNEEVQYIGNFDFESKETGWRVARANLLELLSAYTVIDDKNQITDMMFAVFNPARDIQIGYNSNSSESRLFITPPTFVTDHRDPVTTRISNASFEWAYNRYVLHLFGSVEKDSEPLLWSVSINGTPVTTHWDGAQRWGSPAETHVVLPILCAPPERRANLLVSDEKGAVLYEGSVARINEPNQLVIRQLWPKDSIINYNFDDLTNGYTETVDSQNRWKVGFQGAVSATHLARVDSGELALGKSLRVQCTQQAQIFGVSFPFNSTFYRYPFLEFDYKLTNVRLLGLMAHSGSAFGTAPIFGSRFSLRELAETEYPKLQSLDVWVTKRYDLMKLFDSSSLKAIGYNAKAVDFGDFDNWYGHFDGAYYLLDNVRFLPAVRFEDIPPIAVYTNSPEGELTLTISSVLSTANSTTTRTHTSVKRNMTGQFIIIDLKNEMVKEKWPTGKVTIKSKFIGKDRQVYSESLDISLRSDNLIFSECKYRMFRDKNPWLRFEFTNCMGLEINKIEVYWNGELVPNGDLIELGTTGDALFFKLPERFGKSLREAGSAEVELRGVTDMSGIVSDKPIQVTLNGISGTAKQK